jgi:hypothetical protein
MVAVTESQLTGWTGPSSTTEQDKQDRTERMIREAINAHDAFKGSSYSIYAKGSYANNTNVRSDSDVDIVIECQEVSYWQEHEPARGGHPAGSPYVGDWTPEYLRRQVKAALEAKFPGSVVAGTTAFRVDSSSARVEADVVPCFTFKYYFSNGSFREGTKLFKTSGGSIENYPKLQLTNGRAKNNRTNSAYKKTVRILKRLENAMIISGVHVEVPSYLVECLVYNCPDANFGWSTWTQVLRDCLATIFNQTIGQEPENNSDRWLEVNEAKYLFHAAQKWTRQSAHAFASAAWDYMEFK